MKFVLDADAVKNRMVEQQQTTAELAARAGVSIDTLRRIFRLPEQRYSERVTFGLARALELKPEDFARRG